MIEKVAMRRGLRRFVVVAAAECTDAGEAVPNVERIGNLAELAVADAVDPGGDLLCDNLPDGTGEARLKCRLVKLAASLPRLQKGQQIGRTRQAADMGRHDAVRAELHLARLSSSERDGSTGRRFVQGMGNLASASRALDSGAYSAI